MNGLLWWSPSQVLATIYCVCGVCVRVTALLVFIKVAYLGNKVYQLSPLTLYDTTFYNASHTILKYLCARELQFSKQ